MVILAAIGRYLEGYLDEEKEKDEALLKQVKQRNGFFNRRLSKSTNMSGDVESRTSSYSTIGSSQGFGDYCLTTISQNRIYDELNQAGESEEERGWQKQSHNHSELERNRETRDGNQSLGQFAIEHNLPKKPTLFHITLMVADKGTQQSTPCS